MKVVPYATWSLWTGANLSTALYAFASLGDMFLAGVSMVYAACCVTVIGLTMAKRKARPERADQRAD